MIIEMGETIFNGCVKNYLIEYEVFKQELENRFKKLREKHETKNVPIENADQKLNMLARLQLPNGDIEAEDALALADFAESADLELRINLTHGLELYSSDSRTLSLPTKLDALTNLPTIVACPGCKTCPNAITDCCATAHKLREALRNITSVKSIHLSGCPNDCAQCAVADIGLIGIIRTMEGIRTQCYRILTGGTNGSTGILAKEIAAIPADTVPYYVKTAITGQTQNDIIV
jgi:sulfite reductase beta subunit-like hemoprotein